MTNYPVQCYDPILNFVFDFDREKWSSVLQDTGSPTAGLLLNLSEIPEAYPFGILPKQNILFDLPYYYIGKLVEIVLYLVSSSEHYIACSLTYC